MLNVWANGNPSGRLNKINGNTYSFTYLPDKPYRAAVSLTMPVRPESWLWRFGLHPIFDMNLPEGALRRWLEGMFSKTVPDFDDLDLLRITGRSQIGRLQYIEERQEEKTLESVSVEEILTYRGSEDLFQDLLKMYAGSSGISGVQPKVLVRAEDGSKMSPDHKVTVQAATHIVKTWDERYPELARNEYFCLRAAVRCGMQVPPFRVSDNGRFLVVERFDMGPNGYLGVEDFCVLQGLPSKKKYDGSLERLIKTLKTFTAPEERASACLDIFKMIVLSIGLRNGDAHLKNFCLLYDTPEHRAGCLAPVFDHVTTTAYLPKDIMALTLNGTKRWPNRKTLLEFGIRHCDLTESQASRALIEVSQAIADTKKELEEHAEEEPTFQKVAQNMVKAWEEGVRGLEY